MLISTALKKINTLSVSQLKNMIQRMEIEITNYNKITENYKTEYDLNCSNRYRRSLMEKRKAFEDQLIKKLSS